MATGLAPWAACAADGWAEGRQFGLHETNAGSDATAANRAEPGGVARAGEHGSPAGVFEFGGTYRLGPVSLGQAGRLTFEPLAGGRLIWVHESLGGPNQKVSDSASVIDPIIGGRITYSITDTLEL